MSSYQSTASRSSRSLRSREPKAASSTPGTTVSKGSSTNAQRAGARKIPYKRRIPESAIWVDDKRTKKDAEARYEADFGSLSLSGLKDTRGLSGALSSMASRQTGLVSERGWKDQPQTTKAAQSLLDQVDAGTWKDEE